MPVPEPATGQGVGMPNAALASCCAPLVLEPRFIARTLVGLTEPRRDGATGRIRRRVMLAR
jgi:hypothetical protein